MAKTVILSFIVCCALLCAPALYAHEWEAEVDHFHKDEIEAAFATLEPLAESGELKVDASQVPDHAANLAFGFALALGAWPGSLEPAPEDAPTSYYQAIRTIETLAVLLDASSDTFDGLTLNEAMRRSDALREDSSSAEYFMAVYGHRLLKVPESDRTEALAYAARFDALRAKVLQ